VRERRHAHYVANKGKVAEQSKAWAAANPDKVLEKAARYREKHPERVVEAQAKYGAKPESKARYVRYRASRKGTAYKKAWKAANPDKVRMQGLLDSSRRRARLAGNGVFAIAVKDMRRLLAQSCAECGAAGQHVDHIIPVSRGGRHAIGNLQMLCAPCNLSKNNKLSVEWRAVRLVAA
jgi:5-methylcytosine-specific restriction endonuclease McrA